MTTPDPTPDTEQDVQELTDENLDEVSRGGAILLNSIDFDGVLQVPVAVLVQPVPFTHD